jgi:hypothetical protein
MKALRIIPILAALGCGMTAGDPAEDPDSARTSRLETGQQVMIYAYDDNRIFDVDHKLPAIVSGSIVTVIRDDDPLDDGKNVVHINVSRDQFRQPWMSEPGDREVARVERKYLRPISR